MSPFELVAEHDDFIIINKLCPLSFHDEGQIGNGLFSQVKQQLNFELLYPVHRLDKVTTGLLIFAKNQQAATNFQEQFSQHLVEKYYLAISDQKPKKKQGLIIGDMEKSRRGMWKLLRTTKNPAVTQFFSKSLGHGLRAFILKPHSGKTHQIRVALNSLGSPILGDPLYHNDQQTLENGQEDNRCYLHAYQLNFNYQGQDFQFRTAPSTGEHFVTNAFTFWLAEIANPKLLNWPNV